jgi:hypothetical protein
MTGAKVGELAMGLERFPEASNIKSFHFASVHRPVETHLPVPFTLHAPSIIQAADRDPHRNPHPDRWLGCSYNDGGGHSPCEHGFTGGSLDIHIIPKVREGYLQIKAGGRSWRVVINTVPAKDGEPSVYRWSTPATATATATATTAAAAGTNPVTTENSTGEGNPSNSETPGASGGNEENTTSKVAGDGWKDLASGRLRQRLKRFCAYLDTKYGDASQPSKYKGVSRRVAMSVNLQLYVCVATHRDAQDNIKIGLHKNIPDLSSSLSWKLSIGSKSRECSATSGSNDCAYQSMDMDLLSNFQIVPLLRSPVQKPFPLSAIQSTLLHSKSSPTKDYFGTSQNDRDWRVPSVVFQSPGIGSSNQLRQGVSFVSPPFTPNGTQDDTGTFLSSAAELVQATMAHDVVDEELYVSSVNCLRTEIVSALKNARDSNHRKAVQTLMTDWSCQIHRVFGMFIKELNPLLFTSNEGDEDVAKIMVREHKLRWSFSKIMSLITLLTKSNRPGHDNITILANGRFPIQAGDPWNWQPENIDISDPTDVRTCDLSNGTI